MPAYHIEKSIRIDAAETDVRPAIENFAEWPKWSPWLCMEPTATVNVHGTPGQVGHGYDWNGELVGAGNMEIASNSNGVLDMKLGFLKPFKSQADVKMEIRPVGDDQTEVTWHMDGKLPFFLFFMAKLMKAMIGMDYARGLKMMKEYVETGKVNSSIEIAGVVDVAEMNYLGVETESPLAELGDSMKETIPRAHRLATENEIEVVGPTGAIYSNMDIQNQQCKYAAFIPVTSTREVAGAVTGTIPACKAVKVIHKGNYNHLGNAWSAVMAFQRYKKLKPLKGVHPFEVYANEPGELPEEEWLTEIYLPIRG